MINKPRASICIHQFDQYLWGSGNAERSVVKNSAIEISSHEKAKINNVRQAAEFLLKNWRGPKDDLYKQAVIQCTHAIKGEAPTDAALLHFLVAAKQSKARIELSEDWSKPDEFVSSLWRECESILRTSIDERSTDT